MHYQVQTGKGITRHATQYVTQIFDQPMPHAEPDSHYHRRTLLKQLHVLQATQLSAVGAIQQVYESLGTLEDPARMLRHS